MAIKKKDFDIIVIGTGLSGLSFIESYLEKNKKINVISPDFAKSSFNNNNSHIDKYLPPQMNKKLHEVKNYFSFNRIKVNKNCKVFGALQFGGLSNYWGLQIDQNISPDINYLSSITKKKIKKSFVHIFNKFNLLGKIELNKKTYKRDYKVNAFFKKLLEKKNHSFKITKPILAYFAKDKNFVKDTNLDSVNENKNKFNAENYYNVFLKKKNIIFHNFHVRKIYKKKNKIYIECENLKKRKTFCTKKLVLGCGTIVTTKLILDYLNIKKEVKIKHHPRLFSLFISKYKSKNSMQFMPSTINIRDKNNLNSYVMDFRPGNKLIIDSIINFKKYLYPIKYLLNYFRKNMIFSNIFLTSKYSNLYIKINQDNSTNIFSKNKKVDLIFKKIHKKIFKFLAKEKLVLPIFYNYFPGFGSDFHYFGTIPMTRNKNKLSVNEKCQLNDNKNIYIIDGSVLDFKTNKYPLGIVMANARRIGEEIR